VTVPQVTGGVALVVAVASVEIVSVVVVVSVEVFSPQAEISARLQAKLTNLSFM
jgi:hypothetical protein